MSTVTTPRPDGRYGRASDERADRTLRIVGTAMGAVLILLLGYFGYHYVGQNKISAELISFELGEDAVQVRLKVEKDAGASGYCTVRSQSADGAEVGRADFRFDGDDASGGTEVVTLRTTSPATSAELLGCHAD
ncbi:DUF4307 domain-containing protein [Streptomyces sp. NPDC004610]|uniref:DUF4307 domain-containing protein n=1 Tax=unclassified Streptomyces TaxID=2593676 RepID=UPI0033BDA384